MKLPTSRTRLKASDSEAGALGHIANATYVNYMQAGRREFMEEVKRLCGYERPAVVVNLTIDFQRSCFPGDDIEVVSWCDKLGGRSFRVCSTIYANGIQAARGAAVVVGLNPESGKSEPLPGDWEVSDYST